MKINVTPYSSREWKEYDIPVNADFNRIETGIYNNNTAILAINNELIAYEDGLEKKYEEYKTQTTTQLDAEKDAVAKIESRANESFNTYDNYTDKVDGFAREINDANRNVIVYCDYINKVISSLVKNQYSSSQTFTKDYTFSSTKDPEIIVPHWVKSGEIKYTRTGSNFNISFTVSGEITNLAELTNANGEILLLRIPCQVTPRDKVSLYAKINNVSKGNVVYLKPDGAIVCVNAGLVNNATVTIVVEPTWMSLSWRYSTDELGLITGEL